ncbi:MAG: hypothetical protein IT309_07725, partial [Anaerolineales bacterium]|nr:hypothetical protein [Anaerolineales bacterium]
VWVSIFSGTAEGMVYGIAFVLYALAIIQPLKELAEIARVGLKKIESA